jgi:hypothetical protein
MLGLETLKRSICHRLNVLQIFAITIYVFIGSNYLLSRESPVL